MEYAPDTLPILKSMDKERLFTFDRLDSCFLSPHRIYHLYSLFHSKFTVWQRLRVFKKHLVYWFRFLYCASLIFWHFQIYKLRIGC